MCRAQFHEVFLLSSSLKNKKYSQSVSIRPLFFFFSKKLLMCRAVLFYCAGQMKELKSGGNRLNWIFTSKHWRCRTSWGSLSHVPAGLHVVLEKTVSDSSKAEEQKTLLAQHVLSFHITSPESSSTRLVTLGVICPKYEACLKGT